MKQDLVKRIARTSAIIAALVAPVFSLVDSSAGIHYAVSAAWMIANLLIWMAVITLALRPQTAGGSAPVGKLLLAIGGKMVLLFGGFIALRVFAPYTKIQLVGVIAGVSTILLVAALKAAGARFARQQQVQVKTGAEAHI